MDSFLWPNHTIKWLPHISLNYLGKFLSHSNIFNLYNNNNLNPMDSFLWPSQNIE